MKLSKTLLLVPVASLLFAASVGSGACTSSTSITLPPESSPPEGLTFEGGEFGGACQGNVYVAAGTEYAFCDDDKWAYTTTDPSTDGFTPFAGDAGPEEDASPSADASHPDDGSQGGEDGGQGPKEDATTADDGGQGDDASKTHDDGQAPGEDAGPVQGH
jgi:hypothetical protein